MNREQIAHIICEHLTGKSVCVDSGEWLCPQDEETANEMCLDMADAILAAQQDVREVALDALKAVWPLCVDEAEGEAD